MFMKCRFTGGLAAGDGAELVARGGDVGGRRGGWRTGRRRATAARARRRRLRRRIRAALRSHTERLSQVQFNISLYRKLARFVNHIPLRKTSKNLSRVS